MMGIPLTQRGVKRRKGIAVNLIAWANSTLDNGIHCRGIQFGNLYFEETGMSLFCERYHSQRTGFPHSPVPLPQSGLGRD